jgi:hypothetical protein
MTGSFSSVAGGRACVCVALPRASGVPAAGLPLTLYSRSLASEIKRKMLRLQQLALIFDIK